MFLRARGDRKLYTLKRTFTLASRHIRRGPSEIPDLVACSTCTQHACSLYTSVEPLAPRE